MRELVERAVTDGCPLNRAPSRGERAVTVNIAESPLSWLAARGLLTARQVEAGERLRKDFETAAIGTSITMRWSPRVSGSVEIDPTILQVMAKRRFHDAVSAVGKGLDEILWRTVCAAEGLSGAERGLGWPARSGRVVLGIALERLADHYRLA